MTHEKEMKLEQIKKEREVYEKAISVFDINRHFFLCMEDRKKANENIKKNRFGFFLDCLKIGNENHVRLHAKGFFGGETVEVDSEFVEMCLEYFKRKKKELDEEYANL